MTLELRLEGELLLFAEEEGANGEEAEGDPPNPVIPVGNEIVGAAITFFVLWALMKWVLLPPLLARRAEREEAMRADADAAERARDELAQTREAYERALSGARAEANGLLDQARADADAHRAELQAAADTDITSARAEAQAEIDRARATALDSLRGDVGSLAVEAASLVVQKPLDPAAEQATIDRALGEG